MPIISSIQNLFGSSAAGLTPTIPDPYITKKENWYQALPYGFAFYDIEKQTQATPTTTIYLPISPSNIQVETKFATNVITTLYGVIEEHSATRYYDITISGNTGIAPRYVKPISTSIASPFPADQSITQSSAGRSTFVTSIPAALPGNNVTPALGAITGILGIGDATNPTGVKLNQTGYLAFHNLYKFFLKYKIDASQVPVNSGPAAAAAALAPPPIRKVHPLSFLNYKDGVKYDAVPLSFTMTRSADQPMLYFYNIKMRCFNIRNITGTPVVVDQAQKLGLGFFNSSVFANDVAGALGALSGG